MRTEWTEARTLELETLWHQGIGKTDIARMMGISKGSVAGKALRLNLHYQRRGPMELAADHPAVIEGRSLFQRRAGKHSDGTSLLKTGRYARKIGGVVLKGHWRGMPIYTLTLEERATCPRSCAQWRSCYGNRMHMAQRQPTAGLIERLDGELRSLQHDYPSGFVIRLHVLGDFFSVEYVKCWRDWLKAFPALHAFGYTAWGRGTEIGDAVSALRTKHWDRFAIRTSGGDREPRSLVISIPAEANGAIICPAQTDKTTSCATCGLCWSTKRDVAFLRH